MCSWSFVDCAVQYSWIFLSFLTSGSEREIKTWIRWFWRYCIKLYKQSQSCVKSCSPRGSTGSVKCDSSVLGNLLFLHVSVGPSWSDVGVERICLVVGEVHAGVLKVILLLRLCLEGDRNEESVGFCEEGLLWNNMKCFTVRWVF